MKSKLLYTSRFSWILLTLFIGACAQVLAPEGGPKDYDPPVVVRSVPSNYSTLYNGEDVRIYFNEFVKLKNLNQNMLVSPPLKNDPVMRIKGRSIIMSISDTLIPNTTYNFFFGESIVDITEENPIPNFQFVVSTGTSVDSLSVRGQLRDAYTLKPEPGVFVMMYDNVQVGDSAPLLHRPVYLSKTNKEGEFEINNMREGEYLMFALKDLNSNFFYDSPEEVIAFVDSLITPVHFDFSYSGIFQQVKAGRDTLPATLPTGNNRVIQAFRDSILAVDSLVADSIFTILSAGLPYYQMKSFLQEDTVQRVMSASLAERGKLNIIMRIPADSLVIREYSNTLPQNWYRPEYNLTRDTLTLWMPNITADTLFLEIADRERIVDSVTVSLTRRPDRGRVTARTQASEEPKVIITAPTTAARGVHPYYLPFELNSRTPIRDFDNRRLYLMRNDSIPVDAGFAFTDTLQRTIKMDFRPQPDSTYVLHLMPGAITDIFGAVNDTLRFNIKVNNEAQYGTIWLYLDFTPKSNTQYLLQLLNDNLTNVLEQKIINSSGEYRFEYLPAASHRFRLIEDTNNNGRWDAGNYLKGIQPEPVYIFPDKVLSRLKFDVEARWRLP